MTEQTVNPNFNQKKSPRYVGLVELFHPIIHGKDCSNYKKLLSHYIILCSKNFLLNEDEYENENEDLSNGDLSNGDLSNGELSDSEYDNSVYSDTESETDSETDSDPNSIINSNQGSGFGSGINVTNYAIANEFKYLKGIRNMCLSAYNTIENNYGRLLKSKTIRNYQNIIKSPKYLHPEIFEKVYIHERFCAIIKTFWIRIVQRSWKRVFKERARIKALRKSIKAILYWQMSGRWPYNCSYMPGLRHMIR